MAVLKKTTDTEDTEEKKPAAKKSAAEKAAAKKTTAASKKAAAAEKAAAKKTTAAAKKTTAAEKAAARKTNSVKKLLDDAKDAENKTAKKRVSRKKEPKVDIVIEYQGKQVMADEVIARVREEYTEENPDAVVETIELYIQPERNLAYYVVNKEIGKNKSVKI